MADTGDEDWVRVLAYPNRPDMGSVAQVLARWLRERGVDYDHAIAPDDARCDVMRVRRPDGSMGCDVVISVSAVALKRLGLHPSQETAARRPLYRHS